MLELVGPRARTGFFAFLQVVASAEGVSLFFVRVFDGVSSRPGVVQVLELQPFVLGAESPLRTGSLVELGRVVARSLRRSYGVSVSFLDAVLAGHGVSRAVKSFFRIIRAWSGVVKHHRELRPFRVPNRIPPSFLQGRGVVPRPRGVFVEVLDVLRSAYRELDHFVAVSRGVRPRTWVVLVADHWVSRLKTVARRLLFLADVVSSWPWVRDFSPVEVPVGSRGPVPRTSDVQLEVVRTWAWQIFDFAVQTVTSGFGHGVPQVCRGCFWVVLSGAWHENVGFH